MASELRFLILAEDFGQLTRLSVLDRPCSAWRLNVLSASEILATRTRYNLLGGVCHTYVVIDCAKDSTESIRNFQQDRYVDNVL